MVSQNYARYQLSTMGGYIMAKTKTRYVCQECGYESPGWLGKCPSCQSWNSFVEEALPSSGMASGHVLKDIIPYGIDNIETAEENRWSTGISEVDRVLGGGIVRGSLILVGGSPGIGKSTLLLQICNLAKTDGNILYISGEESLKQIKLRANRLEVNNPSLRLAAGTDFPSIKELIIKEHPSFVIIDSIQTMYEPAFSSSPGSVTQVREITSGLMAIAKSLDISIFIVGHVTKDGSIAGPRVMEHMVDTVLYFEGDKHLSYRILRSAKNRFGSTNELGIFEMKECGLVGVDNPSTYMLSGRPRNVPGSVVMSGIEGSLPMLIEVQALLCSTVFGMPRRMATGIDSNRVTLLMAVLEKRIGLNLGNYDAYVNIIGGIKIDEPASDLGIAIAVSSSFKDKAIDPDTVVIGEIGLTGEIRTVSSIEKRISEAQRMGFKTCIVPDGNYKNNIVVEKFAGIKIIPADNLTNALNLLL